MTGLKMMKKEVSQMIYSVQKYIDARWGPPREIQVEIWEVSTIAAGERKEPPPPRPPPLAGSGEGQEAGQRVLQAWGPQRRPQPCHRLHGTPVRREIVEWPRRPVGQVQAVQKGPIKRPNGAAASPQF